MKKLSLAENDNADYEMGSYNLKMYHFFSEGVSIEGVIHFQQCHKIFNEKKMSRNNSVGSCSEKHSKEQGFSKEMSDTRDFFKTHNFWCTLHLECESLFI